MFPGKAGKPILVTSPDHRHAKMRELLNLPEDFVVHSLRHTMSTRLGLLGVDAFTVMKIAGHSGVTISQRYVHPSPRAGRTRFREGGRLQSAPSEEGTGHRIGHSSPKWRSEKSP